MADAPPEGGSGPEPTQDARASARKARRPLPVRFALWTGGVLLALAALVAAAAVGIDTAPGHRLLVSAVEAQRPPNGLRVRIGPAGRLHLRPADRA